MATLAPNLPTILSNGQEPHAPLLVISSSSHSLSPVPLINHYLSLAQPAVLVSTLYEPRKVGWRKGREGSVVDLRSWVEGYNDGARDSWGVDQVESEIWKSVQSCTSPPSHSAHPIPLAELTWCSLLPVSCLGNSPPVVILDSPSTLAANLGSPSQVAILIARLLSRLSNLAC